MKTELNIDSLPISIRSTLAVKLCSFTKTGANIRLVFYKKQCSYREIVKKICDSVNNLNRAEVEDFKAGKILEVVFS